MLTINALCGKWRCSGEEYINEYQLCYVLWGKQLKVSNTSEVFKLWALAPREASDQVHGGLKPLKLIFGGGGGGGGAEFHSWEPLVWSTGISMVTGCKLCKELLIINNEVTLLHVI